MKVKILIIIWLIKSYMETGERPEKYRREYNNKSPQTANAVKLGQAQDFLK